MVLPSAPILTYPRRVFARLVNDLLAAAAITAVTMPVVAEAMVVNREEIPVYPLYRDPVSIYSARFHSDMLYCFPNFNATC